MINFYQLTSVMNGEEPYELKPLQPEDSVRHALDADFEEELLRQQAMLHDMEVGGNVQTINNPGKNQKIGQLQVSKRPDYEIDGQGNVTPV